MDGAETIRYTTTSNAVVVWICLCGIASALMYILEKKKNTTKPEHVYPPRLVRSKRACRNQERHTPQEDILQLLAQNIAKYSIEKYEEALDEAHAELCRREQEHEDIVDELQKELCRYEMRTAEQEEHVASLQQEICERTFFPNNEEIEASFQQQFYQASMYYDSVIASLQEELYYAKQSQTRNPSTAGETGYPPHNRIESLLLETIDSKGISYQTILKVIRKKEPLLRRADVYTHLRSLQDKGWITERWGNVWAKL